MKASEVIKQLQDLCDKSGFDCEVEIQCDYGSVDDFMVIKEIYYNKEDGAVVIKC